MSFKFNFSRDDVNEEVKKNCNSLKEISWIEGEELKFEEPNIDLEKIAKKANMFIYKDTEISHIIPDMVSNTFLDTYKKSHVSNAEENQSDLIPGVYEGGIKVWECTRDLLEFLIDNMDLIILKDKKVLDLGCGAGLLGLYALLNGASVTFQDYNKEVIELITMNNVRLNIEEKQMDGETVQKCRFFYGDWKSFSSLMKDETFDYILTSETIYNCDNYSKLLNIFCNHLSDSGIVFVAAKTYYFGVGGGTRDFENSIRDNCNSNVKLNSEVCWKSNGGIQREILKIKKV